MAEYRVYLRDGMGFIRARQDFVAESLAEATELASLLSDACSDQCASYELWSGTVLFSRKVNDPRRARLEPLNEQIHTKLIEVEETLHQSRLAIGKSQRVLVSLDAARNNGSTKRRDDH